MKKILIFINIVGCFLACTSTKNSLSVNLVGTKPSQGYKLDTNKFDSLKVVFGLYEIKSVDSCFEGFVKEGQIALAKSRDRSTACLRETGGLVYTCHTLLYKVGSGYSLIDTKEKLKGVMGEVNSRKKALTYMSLILNVEQRQTIPKNDSYVYYVDDVKPTYVEDKNDYYELQLFEYEKYGKGPHYHYANLYHVYHSGEYKLISKTKIYKDPSLDNLWID